MKVPVCAQMFGVSGRADDTGVGGYANVPRRGLRPFALRRHRARLRLDFATPPIPASSAGVAGGLLPSFNHRRLRITSKVSCHPSPSLMDVTATGRFLRECRPQAARIRTMRPGDVASIGPARVVLSSR